MYNVSYIAAVGLIDDEEPLTTVASAATIETPSATPEVVPPTNFAIITPWLSVGKVVFVVLTFSYLVPNSLVKSPEYAELLNPVSIIPTFTPLPLYAVFVWL